jgi:hypothetical protein
MSVFRVREVITDVVRPFSRHQDTVPTRPLKAAAPGTPPPAPSYTPPSRLPGDQEYEIGLAREIFVELSQIPPEARDRVMGMVGHLMDTYSPIERDITPHPQGAPI